MNNKITIYELFGKIKDGQAPKRIKFSEDTFIFEDGRYYEECHINDVNGRLGDYFALDGMLNNEVEILDNEDEEKKIPEKLKLYTLSDNDSADFTTLQDFNNRDIQKTINWILDYLKSKGE